VELPHTDRVAGSLIRLPLFAGMTAADRNDIVAAVDKITNALAAGRARDDR
jgi:dTDP-4-amino-4,6-dideoxygalactose transaminase